MVPEQLVCANLSDSDSASISGKPAWSVLFQERYRVSLPVDLVDWFDNRIWRNAGEGEFCDPVGPEVLLQRCPEVIWPGFMPPDCLPLIGNHYGDWLCLRVGRTDDVAEVIYWYHGGGDWIPWGHSLAEAIVFDRLRERLPGRRQGHAEPAELPRRSASAGSLADWAAERLGDTVASLFDPRTSGAELVQRMLKTATAEVAVRCEAILEALDNPLRHKLTPDVARQMGWRWEQDAVRWMFDPSQISPQDQDRLARQLDVDAGDLQTQDWEAAERHALAVCALRDDLGWARDISGWAAERRGDFSQAASHYRRALTTSSFADQTIRFRTHWCDAAHGKFAAARLQAIRHQVSDRSFEDDPYYRLLTAGDGRITAARQYWSQQAAQAVASQRWNDAYELLMHAGWDIGSDSLKAYRDLLTQMVPAAERAGQNARAAVAQTHLDCLRQRFAL